MPQTWAQCDDMLGPSNLVRRHAHDAAVGPHSLGGQLPGALLRAFVQIQLALRVGGCVGWWVAVVVV